MSFAPAILIYTALVLFILLMTVDLLSSGCKLYRTRKPKNAATRKSHKVKKSHKTRK